MWTIVVNVARSVARQTLAEPHVEQALDAASMTAKRVAGATRGGRRAPRATGGLRSSPPARCQNSVHVLETADLQARCEFWHLAGAQSAGSGRSLGSPQANPRVGALAPQYEHAHA